METTVRKNLSDFRWVCHQVKSDQPQVLSMAIEASGNVTVTSELQLVQLLDY